MHHPLIFFLTGTTTATTCYYFLEASYMPGIVLKTFTAHLSNNPGSGSVIILVFFLPKKPN